MDLTSTAAHAREALVIFAATYAVLGFGSLPPLRIDRTGATLIGATAMVGFGVLTPQQAVAAIDFHTLALLFGMMVVVAHLRFALLTMFAGLFVVVAGGAPSGLTARWLAWIAHEARHSIPVFAAATAALSNLVSNVPAVLVLKAWAAELAGPERSWLVLAMASTLAGNLTLVGSVANLIVVEQARGRARVGFWAYARVGVPLTLVTLALGLGWVMWIVP